MNDRQKEAVEDMGFGHLLRLNIRTLPTKLAYWLVDNFILKRCAIKLDDGMRLKVTEEDVIRVFGFPTRKRKIPLLTRDKSSKLFEKWKLGFADGDRIKVSVVANKMLGYRNGCKWFRQNFLIMMSSTLIESYRSGLVFPYIMPCLEDMSKVRHWNWAEYAINILVNNKRTWEADTYNVFPGPALFLVVRLNIMISYSDDPIFHA